MLKEPYFRQGGNTRHDLQRSLLAGMSRNIYPIAAVQGRLSTNFRCSSHLWQQII